MSDRLGRLLTHPLRHRLLLEYSSGPENPAQIAHRLGEPLNLVSYHTGVLARHGFIELVRTERRRGALTHFYRSDAATVIEAEQWGALAGSLRRSLALGTLAQATEDARQAAHGGGFDDSEAHLSRSPLELDDEGVLEVADRLRETLDELARIAAACRERSARRAPCEIVLMGFEPGPQPAELPAPTLASR
jgi:DNA-binding transcriptional ArsR family regulator